MHQACLADRDSVMITKPFLHGKRITVTQNKGRRQIDTRPIARNQKKRSKGKRATPQATTTKRGGALEVLEWTEEKVVMNTAVLGMESEDDVDVQFLQSDDTDSDNDLSPETGDGPELSNGTGATFEDISETFPFELDKFQTVAIRELLLGKSVVVCAPTGAGKTAIADAATLSCLSKGKKVIYTTPLKALSNQKLHEFRQRFGEERTGLITGDTSIRFHAPIIIMTTEILRNMIYNVSPDSEDQALLSKRLDEIGLVVLDEVHYLGVPGRGSVWEELIVGCPKHIQMLCMSATVANPQDLGEWITQIHGPCSTVRTSKRPVPLSWFFAFSRPKTKTPEMHTLLNHTKTGVNPVCIYRENNGFGAGPSSVANPASHIPQKHTLILLMKEKGLLPAIFFIFSRADCDRQAKQMETSGVCLTTREEQEEIQRAIDDVKADQPEAVKSECVEALINGIATHHAGCLPAWKVLVESLFQNGFLKVVFATGTLAAGINMPARTTVITALSKKIDGNLTLMGHNELLQMAGRAGRRGFDTNGNCVILQNKYEGAAEAVTILKRGTEPLASQFTTGYSFVLNLLAKFTLDEAKVFLEKSFRNYLTGVGLVRRSERIEELKQKAEDLRTQAMNTARGATEGDNLEKRTRAAYIKAKSELREAVREAREERSRIVKERFKDSQYPFPVLIDTTKNSLGHNLLPAMALAEERVASGKDVGQLKLYCLGADNVYYRLTDASVLGVIDRPTAQTDGLAACKTHVLSPKKKWTSTASSSVKQLSGNELSAKSAFKIPPVSIFDRISWSAAAELIIASKSARVKEYKKAPSEAVTVTETEEAPNKLQTKLRNAERQLKTALRVRRELENEKEQGWNGFLRTMKILIKAGALEEDSLTILPLGHVTRELFGENELWMAIVFTHPSVQYLKPSLVAALASAFAAPNVCTKPALSIRIDPPQEITQLLVELDAARSQLYEHEVMSEPINHQSLLGLQMDDRAAGLVEAWAAGYTWQEITSETNMDDGDIARLLSCTVDILRQLRMSNYLLEPLKESATRASRDMNRKPICYDIS